MAEVVPSPIGAMWRPDPWRQGVSTVGVGSVEFEIMPPPGVNEVVIYLFGAGAHEGHKGFTDASGNRPWWHSSPAYACATQALPIVRGETIAVEHGYPGGAGPPGLGMDGGAYSTGRPRVDGILWEGSGASRMRALTSGWEVIAGGWSGNAASPPLGGGGTQLWATGCAPPLTVNPWDGYPDDTKPPRLYGGEVPPGSELIINPGGETAGATGFDTVRPDGRGQPATFAFGGGGGGYGGGYSGVLVYHGPGNWTFTGAGGGGCASTAPGLTTLNMISGSGIVNPSADHGGLGAGVIPNLGPPGGSWILWDPPPDPPPAPPGRWHVGGVAWQAGRIGSS